MFIFCAVLLSLITSTLAHQEYQPISKPCQLGDTTTNNCNDCFCTNNHYFDCTSKPCNKSDIRNGTDQVSCEPSMLYVKKESVCLCKPDGSWPHKECKTIFNDFPNKPINKCQPDSFIIIDCNVCRCGPDGKINKTRCTRNNCKMTELATNRRYITHNQVYGNCEADNWYSLAPCQFCYCVSDNKLVCNTGHSYSKELQLGSYKLNVCGKDLLKDALGLLPEKDSLLRLGKKFSNKTVDTQESNSENHESVELHYNINQNINTDAPSTFHGKKDTEEYNIDSNEIKSAIVKERPSTQIPYEEDENNSSTDTDQEAEEKVVHTLREPNILVPVHAPVDEPIEAPVESLEDSPEDVKVHLPIDIPVNMRELQFNQPARDKALQLETKTTSYEERDFSKHFDLPKNEDRGNNAEFNLGDILKPYLPVVLDKVFQMATRKSKVSIDPNANCNPGSTSTVKCNTCFCMKNKKLLCTNNPCE